MKKYIKEHKIVVAAIALFVILIVISFFVKGILFSETGNAVYGGRLKGMDSVKITKSEKEDLIASLEDDSSVKKAEYSLEGKIVDIFITVNDEVALDTAKTLADKAVEKFDTDQKKYYDFQVFIKKTNDASDFPIIGYRQNTKTSFTWTKDRAAS